MRSVPVPSRGCVVSYSANTTPRLISRAVPDRPGRGRTDGHATKAPAFSTLIITLAPELVPELVHLAHLRQRQLALFIEPDELCGLCQPITLGALRVGSVVRQRSSAFAVGGFVVLPVRLDCLLLLGSLVAHGLTLPCALRPRHRPAGRRHQGRDHTRVDVKGFACRATGSVAPSGGHRNMCRSAL